VEGAQVAVCSGETITQCSIITAEERQSILFFLRMIMNYTPLSDKVIIERIEGEKTTSTGIILKRADEVDRAKVLSIGPDVDEVQVGDVVLLNWNAAIKVEDEMYSTKVENIVFIYGE